MDNGNNHCKYHGIHHRIHILIKSEHLKGHLGPPMSDVTSLLKGLSGPPVSDVTFLLKVIRGLP